LTEEQTRLLRQATVLPQGSPAAAPSTHQAFAGVPSVTHRSVAEQLEIAPQGSVGAVHR